MKSFVKSGFETKPAVGYCSRSRILRNTLIQFGPARLLFIAFSVSKIPLWVIKPKNTLFFRPAFTDLLQLKARSS
jgi:hypothetical protein